MRRLILGLLLPLILAACGAEPVWAPEEAVQAAKYRHDGPPSITLFTMVNNRSNEGAHSSMMINASQRVIFDPAGSWWHPKVPERNDVLYGITPKMLEYYVSYHARESYRVETYTVEVPAGVAELALQLAQENGAVAKALCGRSTSQILNRLPGFEAVPRTIFPMGIMRGFAKVPGATHSVWREDTDPDDNSAVLRAQQNGAAAQPSQ